MEPDFEREQRALGEGPAESRRALQRVRLLRERRPPSTRKVFALTLVGAAVAVAVTVFLLRPANPWVQSDGTALVEGQTVVARATRALTFSEGSQVTLESGSSLQLEAIDSQQVELRLEHGHLDAHVVKGTGRTWRYHAGPWTVRVVGTRLSINWVPERGVLDVGVTEGAVEVTGPWGAPAMVRAGETLERSSARTTPAAVLPLPRDEAVPDQLRPEEPKKKRSVPEKAPAPPLVVPPPTWRELLAQGRRGEALEEATTRGIFAAPLEDADALALADAARLERRIDLAEVLLSRVFERGGPDAAEAAFLLGRFELEAHRPGVAQGFLSKSIALAPRGPFAEQSRGRLLEALLESADLPAARTAARDYLAHHPGGAWEQLATRLGAAP